ncbi:unnamed protein product [Candidula unifasciata]|uniref:DEX1 C-terminal domain-containing protein n=1 Tax=Candidula unifasciata TaxID=100452 RepID=A0A8S3ZAA2_9EUPU|nr:unnamed protein product [Candidula unifasciata]
MKATSNIIGLFLMSVVHFVSPEEGGIASKEFSGKIHRRCPYRLRKLWQTDISSFPFAATPLVVDVDGDGGLDVVAAPTGKPLHDTSWPQHNLDKSVHSSPLQYDIDGDGVLDILFMTTQGEGLFYTGVGHPLGKYSFQLEPAYVKSDWFKSSNSVDYQNIASYVTDTPKEGYIPVDAHILSTPVLHQTHLLIIPVSFYFDDDDESNSDSDATRTLEHVEAKDKFYVGAISVVDLKQLKVHKNLAVTNQDASAVRTVFLELSQTPVFNLFTPTVMDLDGNFGEAEIITGLSSGNLCVMSLDGVQRSGYPRNIGPISGRITIAELGRESSLSLVVINTTGTVVCLDAVTGRDRWSANIGGLSFAGSKVVDVDLDGELDVVIATDEGNVFALHGENGTLVPNYPFKTGRRIAGHVLVTKFNAVRGPVDLVFLSEDGVLHILAADHSCLSQVALADFSLVDILSQNVVLMSRGVELIIATSDGSLVCLGSGVDTPPEELYEDEFVLMASRMASPSSPLAQNDFVFTVNKITVLIDGNTKSRKEITGSSFDLYFSIHGAERGQKFDVRVYMGSQEVHQQMMTQLGSTWLQIQTPEQPGQAQVTVVLYDKHGLVSSDSVYFKFNQLILLDLQWLVLAPFIAMVILLLVNHGFPAKDLLPVTFPFKSK